MTRCPTPLAAAQQGCCCHMRRQADDLLVDLIWLHSLCEISLGKPYLDSEPGER